MSQCIEQKSINLKACRFCLKVSRIKVQIDGNIKAKFAKLMNEELVDNDKLPEISCKNCVSDIEKSIALKERITENQNFLLKLISIDIKEEEENSQDFSQLMLVDPDYVKTEIVENGENDLICHSDEEFKIENEYQAKAIKKENKCDLCDKNFSNKYRLKIHKRAIHPQTKEEYQKREEKLAATYRTRCNECGIEVARSNLLLHRIKVHNLKSDQYFTCDQCGARRLKKYSLRNHMTERHIKKTEWLCNTCGKQFLEKKNLDQHSKSVHQKVISDICDKCGANFRSKATYLLHYRSAHTLETPYDCKFCGKKFHLPNSLSNHVRNSHTSLPQPCELCKKVFKNSRDLKSHILFVHTENNMSCEYEGCNYKYAYRKKYQVHLYKKHSNLKRFVCNNCTMSYRDRDGLANHVYTMHMDFKVNCFVPGCTSSFHRRDYFRTHVKRYHKNLGEQEIQKLFKQILEIKLPGIKEYYNTIQFKRPPTS